MTRALVIGRRRPGRQIAKAVSETGQRLEAAGWTVERAVVDRKGELRKRTRRAVKASVDVVVAVGGDGAVSQVVQRLAGTHVALGIVPMGTGNLLAGNLAIPRRQDEAIDLLLTDGRQRIDLGLLTIDGKHKDFAVACGIGFDAVVMKSTGKRGKRRWGKLAYIVNAIKNHGHVANVAHEITIDGVRSTMDATQVFIANFGGMGLPMEPRLGIHPDDGALDVIVIRASGPLPGLLAGWEALRQRHLGESSAGNIFRARAEQVKIETHPPRLVEIDGSVVGVTPIKASIRPAALTVIVPAK
jgi:YegS/Rv2252/BmrU family lipid kinase